MRLPKDFKLTAHRSVQGDIVPQLLRGTLPPTRVKTEDALAFTPLKLLIDDSFTSSSISRG